MSIPKLRCVMTHMQVSPHVVVVWRPDYSKYSAYMFNNVSTNVAARRGSEVANGTIASLRMTSTQANLLGVIVKNYQLDVLNSKPAQGPLVCFVAAQASTAHPWASTLAGDPADTVVGETNKMQVAGCGGQCPWDTTSSDLAIEDSHFGIEMNQLNDWISDVKQIMSKDLWGDGKDLAKCLSPGYIWIRFGNPTSDYISPTGMLKQPVYVQLSFMKSKAAPQVPIKYSHVLDTIEQLSLCK